MINKKFFILAIFLISLLSISVVSAEDSVDALVFEDSNENIVLNDEISDLELGNSDSTPEDLSVDDTEDVGLDSTDTNKIETDNVVSNEVNTDDVDVEDDVALNSKTKNTLKSSYSYEPYNVYVESVSQKYNYGKYLYFGWSGYFSGYFKVYDSDWYCVHSEYISGYDRDLMWSLDGLDVDTYTAALVSSDDYWLGYGTIKITKSSSKVSVKSVRTKKGYIYFYAYVKDKYNGDYYNGGKVKFRINGKNYYGALKNGRAVIKFKVPKKAKKYTCKATFLGGSNVYSSSKKFTFTVKKHKDYVYKYKTKYKTFFIVRYPHIVSPMLKPFQKKGWTLVKSWYGKKSYNMGAVGIGWDIYGKFKKTYRVKKAKYAYY